MHPMTAFIALQMQIVGSVTLVSLTALAALMRRPTIHIGDVSVHYPFSGGRPAPFSIQADGARRTELDRQRARQQELAADLLIQLAGGGAYDLDKLDELRAIAQRIHTLKSQPKGAD